MQRRYVGVLDLRRGPRLADKAIVRVFALRDLRAYDLDDAGRTEEDVIDLVDLAHAAGAETFHDLVLAVDRLVCVSAQEVSNRL